MTSQSRSRCPVCQSNATTAEVERLSDRRKGLDGEWSLDVCGDCGSMFMDPMPSDSELNRYYEEYYEASAEDAVVETRLGSRAPALRRAYHWLSGDVDPRDFVHIPAGGKVLDYGSGGGTYLAYFHSRGIDIVGADVSETMLAACARAGLQVRRVDSFDRAPFSDQEFDVVYLMQVFEHLRNPRASMRDLARILKPGGHLYLALPNGASFWRRVFGKNWVSGWFAPFHLVHYTAESLKRLGAEFALMPVESWSRTPESWFRINLKATLRKADNRVETSRNLLDSLPFRLLVGIALRVAELFVRERDCVVVHFVKSPQALPPSA